jgi:hypothetical protein
VALYKAPVLALSDFTKPFIMKTNVYVTELRAVPNQEARPLAYLNKALCVKHLRLPIYKNEYLATLMAVERWRHYLKQDHFIFKIDYESLKYLLEQKIYSSIQRKGLIKLLRLRY